MKKVFFLIGAICLSTITFAQTPQRFNYQAVVRNSTNQLLQNTPIGIKVTITQGSPVDSIAYIERHTTTTNQNGLLNIQIGGGTAMYGKFNDGIFWGQGPYFLQTEIDPAGGTNYTITTKSELLSVPFSNYAHVSGSLAGWATDFVGAYKNSGQGGSVAWSTFFTYLGFDKVSIRLHFATGSGDFEYTWFGTVVGNALTIPASGNFLGVSGSGVKTGNNLVFSLTFPGGILDGYPNQVTFNFNVNKL